MPTISTKLLLVLCLLTVTMSAQTESKVQVCVYPSAHISGFAFERAKRITSQILASAGVALEWRFLSGADCRTLVQTRTVILNLTTGTAHAQHPGELACAQVYEGVHITVMIDRIRATAGESGFSSLLAHVMAHEIAHLLQGIPRHSRSGVMRAPWDSMDLLRMEVAPLPFTREDVDLIQRALQSWAARAQRGAGTEWN